MKTGTHLLRNAPWSGAWDRIASSGYQLLLSLSRRLPSLALNGGTGAVQKFLQLVVKRPRLSRSRMAQSDPFRK
jgi:hypothetical protein